MAARQRVKARLKKQQMRPFGHCGTSSVVQHQPPHFRSESWIRQRDQEMGRTALLGLTRKCPVAPWLMRGLSVAGTAAMFLVGGGIIGHEAGEPCARSSSTRLTWACGSPRRLGTSFAPTPAADAPASLPRGVRVESQPQASRHGSCHRERRQATRLFIEKT